MQTPRQPLHRTGPPRRRWSASRSARRQPIDPGFRPGHGAEVAGPGDATEATRKANAAVLQQLPFADREDFELAQRGLIARAPTTVTGRRPGVPLAWDLAGYAFIVPEAGPRDR
jgi:alkyl sulfatase BDS1-like metallo-beta-lactamase superfamily hydrolase